MKCGTINTARAQREFALIQEYRTRLTADVVTGSLGVRLSAAKLVDEAQFGPPKTTPASEPPLTQPVRKPTHDL